LQFRAPKLVGTGKGNTVSTADANVVVQNWNVDVLYLDPPYNSRQYSDTYHVLENIVRWEKPEVFGVSRKFDRAALKSKYSTRSAFEAFSSLIESASAKLIVLSYSNTGLSRATRSNNVLSDKEIHAVLERVGETKVVNVDFKEFSTGKTSKREHKERLFICKVSDE
jgi:adenine-specific DNA methylase